MNRSLARTVGAVVLVTVLGLTPAGVGAVTPRTPIDWTQDRFDASHAG